MRWPDSGVAMPYDQYAEIMRAQARLVDAINRVGTLHEVEPVGAYDEGRCRECAQLWPCDTYRAIEDVTL